MYGNAWISRQKFAAGAEPSWRISARAVQKGNVGLESPHRVSTGALPNGTVRKQQPSFRPQNGWSIDSFHLVHGKAAGTQYWPLKAAVGAIPCRVTGVEMPNTLGAHLLHQCGLYVRHGVKENYFRALRFNDCAAGFWTSMGNVASVFSQFTQLL